MGGEDCTNTTFTNERASEERENEDIPGGYFCVTFFYHSPVRILRFWLRFLGSRVAFESKQGEEKGVGW